MKLYTEDDFADVVDAAGNVVGRAPKSWKDTGLLQSGHSIKARRASKPDQSDGQGGPFDPTAHNQDDVLAYLADADRAEVDRVKAVEAEGKKRAKITEFEPAPAGDGS